MISPLIFGIVAGTTLVLLIVSHFVFKGKHDKTPHVPQRILYIPPTTIRSRPPHDKLPAMKARDYGIQSLAREIAATGNKPRESRNIPNNSPVLERSKTPEVEPKIHPLLSDSREFPPETVFVAADPVSVEQKEGVPAVEPILQAAEIPILPADPTVAPDHQVDTITSPLPQEPAVAEAPLFLNSNGIIINYDAIWHATNSLPQRDPAYVAPSNGAESVAHPLPQQPEVEEHVPAVQSNENHEDVSTQQVEEFVPVIEPVEHHENDFSELAVSEFLVPENRETEDTVSPESEMILEYVDQSLEEEPRETANDPDQSPVVPDVPKSTTPPGFLTFYGLGQQPFDVTPDPGYLYLSRVHREALTSLSQGIQNFRGFMALIAEPGLGKTTVLNRIMEEFRDSSRIVFLFQTQCTSSELLRYLLTELGVEYAGTDVVGMHKKLNDVLFQEMLQGRRFVLIVDEAQNLDDSVLETIRLLSNFETTHSKLIQIVLAGQPELLDTLVRPCLSQLRQRIAILTHLEPLGISETAEYIRHRLRSAGFDGSLMFTSEALELIAERSGGVPRCINNICFNALLSGYALHKEIIDTEIVERVAAQLDMALLVKRTQRELPENHSASSEVSNGNGSSGNASSANGSSENGSSQLARMLIEALTRSGNNANSDAKPKANKGFALTGKLTEKLTSQSWGKKNEFRIQVSLEREYSPSLPIADHYYCRSFYVSEDQAIGLREGKQVRIKFEQD